MYARTWAANPLDGEGRWSAYPPNGEPRFVEDHVRPPSRAYLKLWEAFTAAGRVPRSGDHCVDLGSSPGGWTWALERLGARVTSVDKAPLDERLTRLTRVRYVPDSAFAIDPGAVGRVDWLVSNVICYPARSVALVGRWVAVHPSAGFVIAIKFQGATDMAPLRARWRRSRAGGWCTCTTTSTSSRGSARRRRGRRSAGADGAGTRPGAHAPRSSARRPQPRGR